MKTTQKIQKKTKIIKQNQTQSKMKVYIYKTIITNPKNTKNTNTNSKRKESNFFKYSLSTSLKLP
jgi:hypothetical protein